MDPETITYKDLVAVMAQHEAAYQHHEAVLTHHEELMAKHSELLADVMESISQLFQRLPGSSPSPALRLPPTDRPQVVAKPRLPPPKHFSGNANSCRGFLTQCYLTFELQPSSFPTHRSKIAYIISLLADKVLSWGNLKMSAVAHTLSSWRSLSGCLTIQ